MPKFKVACSWQMMGEFEVEAETLDEAIEKVEDDPQYEGLPEGEYVDDSFEIDRQVSEAIN